ncbi:ERF family protein [Cronobacter dublinensis]|nr:ERF family protein [Cronobacter dublinensis]ELY4302017.1 ERF family protein [Cronobacter turicensis]MDI7398448.1 ERF family protein [Cronobacter dublinensis]
MTKPEFYARLAKIQAELNAPKNQFNSFGGYSYRSCEDILNAVKPLLDGLFLSITDDVIQLGDRFYIRATATITDGENSHSASALAREAITKKGMDDAQVTGATSSYARKYCLNGLFGIDDAKDPDTDEHARQNGQQQRNGNQQRNGGQQQRRQGNIQQPQRQQQGQQTKNLSPAEVYTTFVKVAAKTTNRDQLDTLYKRAWRACAGDGATQGKLREAMQQRINQLKQAQAGQQNEQQTVGA